MKNTHTLRNTLLFMLLIGLSSILNAQVNTQDLPASSLENRLNKIIQLYGDNISFNSKLIENSSVPPLPIKGKNGEQVLKESLSTTSFTYKKVSEGSYVIIKKPLPVAKKKPGKITGKVVDNTSLSLPGATIRVIENDVSTISDTDGNYSLSLDPGTYTIEVSFMSFQTQKITGIQVSENDSTPLNIALKEDVQSLQEVVITQTYKKATASVEGMLLQQRKAAQFSDGISAEQIARTPDKDVGATLKRITGVTTVDDKYVVVRSMGERWNQAVMDGINLPSTDAVQQQFSFDIIPTAMVESVVVSKSATPDMNANFAGGYVEIRTKAIPKENFTSFSIGNSYNSRSTFKDRLTKQEGSNDYLGFDDGTRDYPALENLTPPASEATAGAFIEQSKKFTQDNFTTYKTYAAPGNSLQFALGRTYDLKDGNRWGFVGSLLFKNTQENLDIEHTERGTWMRQIEYEKEPDGGYATAKRYGFRNHGASYNFNSALGGMFNAGIQLGKHKITTRNIVMHSYDNTLTQITGWNYYSGGISEILNGTYLPYTSETNYPVYQNFVQSKVEGEHKFGDLEIDWFGAYGTTSKDTKDATFTKKLRKKVGDDQLIYQQIYNSELDNFKRANFTNDEKNYNVGINFKYAVNFGDSFQNDIKAGYFGTYKEATNQQESAGLVAIGQGADVVDVTVPISELLDGSYYKWGGFGWQRTTNYGKEYKGDVKIHAPFLMLDNKISRFVRLVWGVRAESFVYTQISSQADNPLSFSTVQKDEDVWQYLPSVNLTVSPNNKMNLRLGYNKSVLRPQFAERLNMPYYDPVRNAQVLNWTGGIVSTEVENYDFKAEWFPSRGEILSFGVYSKKMENPIEAVGQIGGDGGSRTIYNMNSHSAKLWGLEMEIYKNLSFLGEGDALNRIFFYANGAINKTKVTGYVNIDGTGGLYEANRPLYGQSPYNYNLGLDYIGDRMGFSIRHNATGDQYLLVGFDYNAEEIRMPYSITDAQVSYKFFKEKNLELKCGIKNLFDSAIETYNNKNSYTKILDYEYGDNPRDQFGLGAGTTKKYDEGIDDKVFKAWTGRTISLSINYSF